MDAPLPWDDSRCWLDEYKDLWVGVIRVSYDDYQRGLRQGQHHKFVMWDPKHRNPEDARDYRRWVAAAHWFWSESAVPRTFRWLMEILRADPDEIRNRLDTVTNGCPRRGRKPLEKPAEDDDDA